MIDANQLLGFAFANADLLLEVDMQGIVAFATGATTGICDGPADVLAGCPAAGLFRPADSAKFLGQIMALQPGTRCQPMPLQLQNGAWIYAAMFRLREDRPVSCTIRRSRAAGPAARCDEQTGLSDRDTFLAAAESRLGGDSELHVAHLPGLAPDGTAPDKAAAFLAALGASLKALGTAGRLAENVFAVIRERGCAPEELGTVIEAVARRLKLDDITVNTGHMPLDKQDLTPGQAMLAVRHAVNRLAGGGAPQGNLAETLNQMVQETLDRVRSLNRDLSGKPLQPLYETVVELKSGKTARYRFSLQLPEDAGGGMSFLREVGLAGNFDSVAAAQAFAALEDDPKARFGLLVEISGRTLAEPGQFALLSGLLRARQSFAPRLWLEISDLPPPSEFERLQEPAQYLRQCGYRLGLRHFESNPVPLSQLANLQLDFLTLDAAALRGGKAGDWNDRLLRSQIAACAKLDIETLADGVESHEDLVRARELGVKLGFGRYFGHPVKSITTGIAA